MQPILPAFSFDVGRNGSMQNSIRILRILRLRPALAGSLLAGALLLLASPALARSEALRWSEANPAAVSGFKVYWTTSSGPHNQSTDIGKPSPDAAGNFHHTITVPDADTLYVAITAYNASGQESGFSNLQARFPPGAGNTAGSGGNATAPASKPAPPAPAPLGIPGRPQLVAN